MRIGLAQMKIKFEDKAFNMEKAEIFFEKAAAGNADFIVFPEMCLTGFSMHTHRIGEDLSESETLDFFRKCAQKYEMAVCFGFVRLEQGKAFNSAALLDKKGNLLGLYDKIHPFSGGREAAFYTGGTRIVSEEIDGINVSPFICYDLRFPEIFQAASEKSGLLAVIGNWPKVRGHLIAPLTRARAIENQSYALFVNTTGFDGKILYDGGSVCFDPWGNEIFSAGNAEGLYVFEIDENLPQTVRESFKMRPDRRNGLYVRLYEEWLLSGKGQRGENHGKAESGKDL